MNPRVTLIVVAIFALLLGYVFFVEGNKTPEQLGTPAPTLAPHVYSLPSSNVKSIEVRDLHMVRTVQIDRTSSGSQITKPENAPADSTVVDSAVNQLTDLSASRVLTNVTDLKPFGLLTATVEVRLIMSDTTPYALTVGDKTPDGSSYYVDYTGDKSKVYLVGASNLDPLIGWLNSLPYQPTATPTEPPTPVATPTVEGTPGATPSPGGTPLASPTP